MQNICDTSASGMHDAYGYLRRSWAEVNLDALDHNVKLIQARIPKTCALMGVVKADAYGHGDIMIAKRLVRAGAAWLGVSNIDEAMVLRRKGILPETGILIFGDTPVCYTAELARWQITQAVYSPDYAQQLSAEAVRLGVTVQVHIKADTGMSRIGFVCLRGHEAAADQIAAACALPGLDATGLFTHFSCADDPDAESVAYTRAQLARYTALCHALKQRGIVFRWKHCCNSAGILNYPEAHFDMVRAGIILYGLAPSPSLAGVGGFTPILELKTVVSQVKTIFAGQDVSYGRIFRAHDERTIASVCIGYADGYLRAFSNRANMLVHGRPAPITGRVCMDQLMLDVTGIPDVKPGDAVTVFGFGPVTADSLAALLDTVGYELVCLISRRVAHVYYSGGQQVAVADYIRSK